MPTLPISEGGSLFFLTFLFILTPKFGNLPISGKFYAIEVACNFENLLIFCLNPPYFLDVKGVFRNTLVGGLGKMEGGQKSFELPEGGTKKFSRSKGRGVKKVLPNW